MRTRQRPINICFPFSGDDVGGSHISALGLIQNLDPREFRSIIVVQHRHGRLAEFFAANGVRSVECLQWTEFVGNLRLGAGDLIRSLRDIPRLVRFLRAHRVDIVHTNDGHTHANWALASRLAGCKLLWHHRGDPGAAGLRLAAPLLANRVVSVSDFAAPEPGRYSAARRTHVVYSPFDTAIEADRAAARAAIIEELGCGDTASLIGFFGLFIDRKRPFKFIEAIADACSREGSRRTFGLMFGRDCDGKTEEALRSHARDLGVADRIKFMGFRTDAAFWLAGCDVLMVPAFREPFGRTLIEAMLVGTPIVACDSGGNREALKGGDLGVLVPSEDAQSLATECLRMANDDGQARTMTSRAREDALNRFGVERHVSRISDIYRELIPQSVRSGRRAAVAISGTGDSKV